MVLAPLLARPIRRGKEKLVYDGLIIFFIDRRRQMDRQSLCSVRLGQYALTVDSYFGDLRIYSVRGGAVAVVVETGCLMSRLQ